MTGEIFIFYLKTPNNIWNLIVPRISKIQYFIDMTISYELLSVNKNWGIFDTYNNIQMDPTKTLLEWELLHNSPNRINVEVEIKEI